MKKSIAGSNKNIVNTEPAINSKTAQVTEPTKVSTKNVGTATNKPTSNVTTPVVAKTNVVVFTASTLAQYNGLNGKPSYVAVDGVVYDMTNLFRNGQHFGNKAGQDLSTIFHGQHPNNLLGKYAMVGNYVAN